MTRYDRIFEKGQSLIEFSISLVFLMILISGVFDTARALFTYLAMRDAAQEGAIYAATEPARTASIVNRACASSNTIEDLCDFEDGVMDDYWTEDDLKNDARFDITVSYAGDKCRNNGSTNWVQVTVHYANFPLTTPIIGELIGVNGSYSVPISASIKDTIISPTCSP